MRREGDGPVTLREPGFGSAFADPDIPPPKLGPNATTNEQAQACADQTPQPIQALGAHVSPLGVAYWALPTGPAAKPWPAQYEDTVFVAQHGCAAALCAQMGAYTCGWRGCLAADNRSPSLALRRPARPSAPPYAP